MRYWKCCVLLVTFLFVTWLSAEETEICKEVIITSQPLQHNSAFIKDGNGNAAEITSVSLLEQRSKSPCVKWETFAHYGSSLLVKDGCHGRFNVCYTSGVPPPSVPLTEEIDCMNVQLLSQMRKPAVKTIARSDGRGDLIVSMTLLQSFSAVSCVPGLTYSYYGHKVESKFGCKGDFRVCIDPLFILESDTPDFLKESNSQS